VVSSVVVSDAEARDEFAGEMTGSRSPTWLSGPRTPRPPGSPLRKTRCVPTTKRIQGVPASSGGETHPGPPAQDVTQADVQSALEAAAEAKKECASGVAFQDLVQDYSDTPDAASGGDLGWITRGALGDAAAESTLFAMTTPGSISDPVRGAKGVYLFELVERDAGRVHARRILIDIAAGRETVSGLVSRARAFARRPWIMVSPRQPRGGGCRDQCGALDEGSPPRELLNAPNPLRFALRGKKGELSPRSSTKKTTSSWSRSVSGPKRGRARWPRFAAVGRSGELRSAAGARRARRGGVRARRPGQRGPRGRGPRQGTGLEGNGALLAHEPAAGDRSDAGAHRDVLRAAGRRGEPGDQDARGLLRGARGRTSGRDAGAVCPGARGDSAGSALSQAPGGLRSLVPGTYA